MTKLRFADVRKRLATIDMSIRKTPGEREYRVTFKGIDRKRAEDVASYQHDLDDALDTAIAMRAQESANYINSCL